MTFRELMDSKGMSINQLAAAVGVSPRSLEPYSRGQYPLRNARAWMFIGIAEALDVTPQELLALDQGSEGGKQMDRYRVIYSKGHSDTVLSTWCKGEAEAKAKADALKRTGYTVDIWEYTKDGARKI